MSTEMTICLAILYFAFWVWGSYSRKAQVNTASDTNVDYINYFPLEEEEEELIKEDSSSSEDWSQFTNEEFVLALGEMVTVPTASVAVIDDPWEQVDVTPIEFEFNKCQLEYQLALPPAPVTDTETYNSAQFQVIYDYYAEMTIRELKAECKRLGIKKYSYLKKQQLIELLSQQYI